MINWTVRFKNKSFWLSFVPAVLLLAQVAAAGRRPAGEPLELYRIDAHDTNREAEYVTELQVPVR